eukprot:1403897-Prymnesium_polylepis.1
MEDPPAWETAKENVQPLRKGRTVAAIHAALEEGAAEKRELRRVDFERRLGGGVLGDRLTLWWQYLQWVHEEYITDANARILPLLHRCVGEVPRYRRWLDDPRFLAIVIALADLGKDPEPIFERAYAQGVCRARSALYLAWAAALEACGKLEACERVYRSGLLEEAHPLAPLKRSHVRFLTRRALLQSSSEAAVENAPPTPTPACPDALDDSPSVAAVAGRRRSSGMGLCLAAEWLFRELLLYVPESERSSFLGRGGSWDFAKLSGALKHAVLTSERAKASAELDEQRAAAQAQLAEERRQAEEERVATVQELALEAETLEAERRSVELRKKQMDDELVLAQRACETACRMAPPPTWLQIKHTDPWRMRLVDVSEHELEQVMQALPGFWSAATLPALDAAGLLSGMFSGNFEVLSMQRVQNLALWEQYSVRKAQMINAAAAGDPGKAVFFEARYEKKWLFHGTSGDTSKAIAAQGFNRVFCGRNATRYGRGTYFARDASYSTDPTYAVPDRSGERHLFLCRVLCGEWCKGDESMKQPPPRGQVPGMPNWQLYDSTVDNPQNPSIFVVYHDAQAYP